ncbi:MAG: conjugal transfer protein TraF [Enterobacter hormaechei]|nr:conjugal transfer protein TraF [Enterobacter hormaechei]
MKKHFKFSMVSIAVSFFMANQAGAANTWTEARSDAMGGTGVAAGRYGSGALINPALLAKSKPEDDVTVILPSVGVQVTDEDNLQDEIDTINDKINHYKDVVDSLTPIEVITNPLGSINQFQGAAKDLADELDYLKGKTAHATAGAGIAVSIPNDVLSVAFMAKGYAHGRVSSSIDQQDIDYLRGIQRSDAVAAGVALDAALNGTDQITKNLNSTASGRAAIVSDYGIAADFGENWTVGVSGQNLMSRDIDTKDIRIRNGRTGEVVSYKDTYQIRPLVTAGAAWHNDLVTLTADGDLTETKGFKSEDTSQYVGVGAEVTPLSWLAVRAGYRADMKGNDSNVFTGGVGFAPFNAVHVDLMGLYGEDETWGAGAQLSMTF